MAGNYPNLGLIGAAGAGKTEVAKWLVGNRSYVMLRFAHPVKMMTKALINHMKPKADPRNAEWFVSTPEGKATEMEFLAGMTPRYLMQTLGTEWGRNTVDPDLWVMCGAQKMNNFLAAARGWTTKRQFLFDDVRFQNEVDLIHATGGQILRVVRPGQDTLMQPDEAQHASETQTLDHDLLLTNTGTIKDIHDRLAEMFPKKVT